jgi:ankyrin repeat protein
MADQGHKVTPETWNSIILQILPKLSPNDREFLHRATQRAQPTSQSLSIDAGELEGWTLRFLASLADKPSWEKTVSLANEHHQTLAHIAVLFQSTNLLKKVTKWGIDVDVQDVNGYTARHYAYLCGDMEYVGILKGYGADEDI